MKQRPTLPQLSLFSPAPLLPSAPPTPPAPVDLAPPPQPEPTPDPAPARRRPLVQRPAPAPVVFEPATDRDLISAEEALRMLREARKAAARELAQRERALSFRPASLEGKLNASVFLLEHGRLPRLGDEIPPWRYHGWLLCYVQLLHAQNFPLLGDRWGYYLRTLAAGALLPDPIPPARFDHVDSAALRKVEEWVRLIEQSGFAIWSAFSEFVDWLGYGMGTAPEPRRPLPDALQEALYRQVNLGLWLQHPADYLGTVAAERFGGGPFAFFPTPPCVGAVLASLTMDAQATEDPETDPRLRTVSEPCCGSGQLLLAASNYSLCLSGIDKDLLMVAICKINMACYAPWGLWGLPWLKNPELGVRLADALACV